MLMVGERMMLWAMTPELARKANGSNATISQLGLRGILVGRLPSVSITNFHMVGKARDLRLARSRSFAANSRLRVSRRRG
jgi:hypothetical protein